MFVPNYTINNQILKNISSIEAAREMIDNAPIIPVWEKRFAQEAIVRTVHYGTHLEGNPLELNEVMQVFEGKKIMAHERDIQEIINYRLVVDYISRQAEDIREAEAENTQMPSKNYSIAELKKIHQLTVNRILPENQSGALRKTRVVLTSSRTGEITFRPPPPIEVPYQLEAFFTWLDSDEGKENHSVIRAGITHLELVRIHPFVDGNGRVARAYSTLVLYREGYDINRFFSLEEHFDKEAGDYYGNLMKTSSGNGDITLWLEYFTRSLAIEFERVKAKIQDISSDYDFKNKLGRQITISEREEKLIKYLRKHDFLYIQRARKLLEGISDDTILREINDLILKGIVKKVGRTKGAKYKLVSP